jgi:hypothetical protein
LFFPLWLRITGLPDCIVSYQKSQFG